MSYFNINLSLIFDPLSLFFLLVILITSVPAAVYSVGYFKEEYSLKKIILQWGLFTGFVFSMALVVISANLLLFIIAWELMSVISYFLVTFDISQRKSVNAGIIYIVMTHIGTAFIILAFFLMFKYANSLEFFAVKYACGVIPERIKNIIFLLLLIGFGTKAGIVPMHIWLPYAHPQASSPVSSVMSGAMIKIGIYGMLRFVIFMLGINSLWWGYLILFLACACCLTGVVYALMENDLKKLLAYSSIENIGIILLGVGACMVFVKFNMPVLAVFSLVAGLYHLINHAIFKALLFLCAGSVSKACGTKNIEKLGGLIKIMPWTSSAFLIGAMAISAIPPLNGFVGEWLALCALFSGALNSTGMHKIIFSICAAVLALTGGLAAACFVKAFGITCLALPRSQRAKDAKESALSMKISMIFMSLLVLIFGFAAGAIINNLLKVSGNILDFDASNMSFGLNNFTAGMPAGNGVYLNMPLLILLPVFILAAVFLGGNFIFGRQKTRINKTWDCGYYNLDSRAEYTSTAFSKPFRIAFSFFYCRIERRRKQGIRIITCALLDTKFLPPRFLSATYTSRF